MTEHIPVNYTTTDTSLTVYSNKKLSSQCKVCGAPARYTYYGAIVCHPCKMFFRRNATNNLTKLKCPTSYGCQINVNTRHKCPACRLIKCFVNGMRIDLIRRPTIKKNDTEEKESNMVSDSVLTILRRRLQKKEPPQLPTLNLVRKDLSTLNRSQWNLLSNVIHCFDEYAGYAFVKCFVENHNHLPVKIRFRCTSVKDFITSVKTKVQIASEKNGDLMLVPANDRSILLRCAAEYATTIGGLFLQGRAHLFDNPSYVSAAEMIFGSASAALAVKMIQQLDPDDTFIKLILAMVSFSTIRCTIYGIAHTLNLNDSKLISSLQDKYIELAWKYVSYKYGHYQAVIRFSNLIRCLFCINDSIFKAHESRQFAEMMNKVIQQSEQTLRL